jgi:hypothetical protein
MGAIVSTGRKWMWAGAVAAALALMAVGVAWAQPKAPVAPIEVRVTTGSPKVTLIVATQPAAPERELGTENAWIAEATRRKSVPYQVEPGQVWRPDDEHQTVSRWRKLPAVETGDALRGEMGTLKRLLAAKKIPRDVYDAEMKEVQQKYGAGPRIDELRGHLDAVSRLYHTGRLDTETFLKYQDEAQEEWYHAINILPNGDFEQVEDEKAPDRLVDLVGWGELIWGHMDLGQSRVAFDRTVKRRGRQSLRFSAPQGPSSIEFESARFFCVRDDSLKIRFWVKAENLRRGYYGRTLCLYFWKSDGLVLSLQAPEGTYDWAMMEARLDAFAAIPEGKVEPCYVECQFFGEGTVWLDDVVVAPTTRAQRARLGAGN